MTRNWSWPNEILSRHVPGETGEQHTTPIRTGGLRVCPGIFRIQRYAKHSTVTRYSKLQYMNFSKFVTCNFPCLHVHLFQTQIHFVLLGRISRWRKVSLLYMQPHCSLSWSHKYGTGPYPKLAESSSHFHDLVSYHILTSSAMSVHHKQPVFFGFSHRTFVFAFPLLPTMFTSSLPHNSTNIVKWEVQIMKLFNINFSPAS